MLDFTQEYNLGVRDATKDLEKYGVEYSKNLLEGQDESDPYIQGYLSVVIQW